MVTLLLLTPFRLPDARAIRQVFEAPASSSHGRLTLLQLIGMEMVLTDL